MSEGFRHTSPVNAGTEPLLANFSNEVFIFKIGMPVVDESGPGSGDLLLPSWVRVLKEFCDAVDEIDVLLHAVKQVPAPLCEVLHSQQPAPVTTTALFFWLEGVPMFRGGWRDRSSGC